MNRICRNCKWVRQTYDEPFVTCEHPRVTPFNDPYSSTAVVKYGADDCCGAVIAMSQYFGCVLFEFSEILQLTSLDWCKELGIKVENILDPDGWDRSSLENFTYSFNDELISHNEFQRRYCASTIRMEINQDVDKKLQEG